MPQKTNLNVAPYYDDFAQDKNFYKVLFRPGYSIQARELTQLQSILQNQIESFGKYAFKQGELVIPGEVGLNTKLNYFKLSSVSDVNPAYTSVFNNNKSNTDKVYKKVPDQHSVYNSDWTVLVGTMEGDEWLSDRNRAGKPRVVFDLSIPKQYTKEWEQMINLVNSV